MENLGLNSSLLKQYDGKRVFVTGHTGFKGSWLSLWLSELGSSVTGYSLGTPTFPSHFESLDLSNEICSISADIRDLGRLKQELLSQSPEIVFHLAAQSLVRESYSNPIESFETNAIGTANILEACRSCESVRAVIVVTSDKCYENNNQLQGYMENDSLGGHDPYSASKACAELITGSYRSSFFESNYDKDNRLLVATVRAGNVVGGGDWSDDRLIPDLVRSIEKNEVVKIRYPNAVRPWQHVLDCLSGYLMLGQHLLEGNELFAESWNFGPSSLDEMSVESLVKSFVEYWPSLKYSVDPSSENLHEASILVLNSEKARTQIGWKPVWGIGETIEKTQAWYVQYLGTKKTISREQLHQYINDASHMAKTMS